MQSSSQTPGEALDLVIPFKKDPVAFYASRKKAVPEDPGKRQIDLLIGEEIRPISILLQKSRSWWLKKDDRHRLSFPQKLLDRKARFSYRYAKRNPGKVAPIRMFLSQRFNMEPSGTG
jgi:hypothetical protein